MAKVKIWNRTKRNRSTDCSQELLGKPETGNPICQDKK